MTNLGNVFCMAIRFMHYPHNRRVVRPSFRLLALILFHQVFSAIQVIVCNIECPFDGLRRKLKFNIPEWNLLNIFSVLNLIILKSVSGIDV